MQKLRRNRGNSWRRYTRWCGRVIWL